MKRLTLAQLASWLPIFRIGIALVVALAIGYTVWTSIAQLEQQAFDVRNIQFGWWLLAVVSYLGAMTLSGTYWHQLLKSFGQQPVLIKSLSAFFISQLGKYVPGKAMVVVLRTDAIRGKNVAAAPAAVSVFVETLTWIFTGSAIGSLLLLVQFDNRWLQIIAAIMTIFAGVFTLPWTLGKIATLVAKIKNRPVGGFLQGLTGTTMIMGWLLLSAGWLLNGLCLWLILRGLVGTETVLADYWLALTCVTLATSAGFVSLLPGGLGVRELVMIPLLSTRFDPGIAVVAALAIRVVCLSAELLMSGLMVWISGFPKVSSEGTTG